MSKKILTVLGARPQFIKASVVSAALAGTDGLSEVIVHTGQHFDANMSDVFFAELGMPQPDHNLAIHGGSHGDMTGRMLIALEQVMLREAPDAVLVYGDTNSTLAGALAAAKLHIPIAHVEAGLRSFNMRMPEEVNRVLTDRISHWLFTPTQTANANLKHEGFAEERIISVGDVMYDVALFHGARVDANGGILATLGLQPKKYILTTLHRAENTDSPSRLQTIVDALLNISKQQAIVWPLHPRTRDVLIQMGLLDTLRDHVHLIDPVGYLDMVQMEKYAALIATDSGGVQKEAFFHQVPCITLRDETEWMELVAAGWNRLVPPTSADAIKDAVELALMQVPQPIHPYGNGMAAQAIAQSMAGS